MKKEYAKGKMDFTNRIENLNKKLIKKSSEIYMISKAL